MIIILHWYYPTYIKNTIKSEALKNHLLVNIGDVRLHTKSIELHDVEIRKNGFIVRLASLNLDLKQLVIDNMLSITSNNAEISGKLNDSSSLQEKIIYKRQDSKFKLHIILRSLQWRSAQHNVDKFNAQDLKIQYSNGLGYVEAKSIEAKVRGADWLITKLEYATNDDIRISSLRISSVSHERVLGQHTSDIPTTKALNIPVIHVKNLEILYKKELFKAFGTIVKIKWLNDGWESLSVTCDKAEWEEKLQTSGLGIQINLRHDSGKSINGQLTFDTLGTHNKYVANTNFTFQKTSIKITTDIFNNITSSHQLYINIDKIQIQAALKWGSDNIDILAEMPTTQCQDILESVPKELVNEIMPGTKLNGQTKWNVHIAFDMPHRINPIVGIKFNNGCKVINVPESIDIKNIKKPFPRQIYTSTKLLKTIMSGPGTPNWIPLTLVSPFIPVAIKTLEDPGFMGHRGFLIQALENSLIQDIQTGKLVRGGSTITMQLAKNLWLNRNKNLSRKLQELILTIYLEQNLNKDTILEYYMNIVEFGPNIYGIKDASHYYFNKHPANLSLSQSLFLASILPKPNGSYFDINGILTNARILFIRRIMKSLLDKNLISEFEYEKGIRETPAFKQASTGNDDIYPTMTSDDGIDPAAWHQ